MPFANPIQIPDDLLSAVTCGQEHQADYPNLVAPRLKAISQCLANVEAATASLTSTIMSEFEDIFASLDLGSHDSPTEPPAPAISPAQWLLDNLHNPYPSNATKRAMEHSPALANRTVNEWFARARQRIGWTRLLRDRFGGCRSAATDAAFRAYVRDDPYSPLDTELYAAFEAVRAHANLVYTPSSPGIREIASHSSPPARYPSVTPSLTHSAISEDSGCGAIPSSRKRKRPCSELPFDPLSASFPLRKRPSALPTERVSRSLSPSPTSTQSNSPPSPARSRKRRLSESNFDEPTVKKPRSLDWALRNQIVSDPLPLPAPSFDWESWCTEAFALPPSVAANHQVPDALDFELFNFEAFPTSQPIDITGSLADALPRSHKQPYAQTDALFMDPNKTEKGPWPAPWDDFFSFELPCQTSSLPSLTNSPSSSESLWSLSPPQLASFDPLGSTLFDFSSPSLFKIPALYPTDGVEIVDNNSSFIL